MVGIPGGPTMLMTLLIQGAGILATLGVTLVISARLGPAGQGFWASFKSMLDLASVIATYGFPMAFPFMVNVRAVSPIALARFTAFYCVAGVPVIAAGLGLASSGGLVVLASDKPAFEIAVIALAAAAVAGHAMMRGLALATTSTSTFNVISSIPPLALLFGVLVVPAADPNYLLSIALGSTVGSLVICSWLWLTKYERPTGNPVVSFQWGDLLGFGGWTFVVNVLAAVAPVLLLQMLIFVGVDRASIGSLSIALLVQGALLAPANVIGPLLFNAWSKESDIRRQANSYRYMLRLAWIGSSGVVLIAGPITAWLLPEMLGSDFERAVEPAWIMMASVPAAYWLRIMANVLLSSGMASWYAVASLARVVTLAFALLMWPAMDILAASWIWVFGDFVLCIALATVIRVRFGWPLVCLLGIR
jgi:O-antigen/teichoic acid export membrane protein